MPSFADVAAFAEAHPLATAIRMADVASRIPFEVVPIHQCQEDWPREGDGSLLIADDVDGRGYGPLRKVVYEDLKSEKPLRPTEPLLDCPGRGTEPSYAHRGNVVCSSDESRRLIE